MAATFLKALAILCGTLAAVGIPVYKDKAAILATFF